MEKKQEIHNVWNLYYRDLFGNQNVWANVEFEPELPKEADRGCGAIEIARALPLKSLCSLEPIFVVVCDHLHELLG